MVVCAEMSSYDITANLEGGRGEKGNIRKTFSRLFLRLNIPFLAVCVCRDVIHTAYYSRGCFPQARWPHRKSNTLLGEFPESWQEQGMLLVMIRVIYSTRSRATVFSVAWLVMGEEGAQDLQKK